jgi:hypothetical protein
MSSYRATLSLSETFRWHIPTRYHSASHDVLCSVLDRDAAPHIAIINTLAPPAKLKEVHNLQLSARDRAVIQRPERSAHLDFTLSVKAEVDHLSINGLQDAKGALALCDGHLRLSPRETCPLSIERVPSITAGNVTLLHLEGSAYKV